MLTEKYLAGLIDSDGSFGVRFFRRNAGDFRPAAFLNVSQVTEKNKVLYLIQERFGGFIGKHCSKTGYGGEGNMTWGLSHTEAKKMMARIEKHLVVKRARVKPYLKYLQEVNRVPSDKVLEHREYLKSIMKIQSSLPNYPSRKWLAGYFDGDGCFASRLNKQGFAYLSARLTAHINADAGVRLLYKAFGGGIYFNKGPYLPMWCLHLEPSKAKEFLGYFLKHLIIKKTQGYFVLGCAEGGNYRDGHTIHNILREQKAQGQRLNEPEVDHAELLSRVRFDVPDGRGKHWQFKRESSMAVAM